MSLTYDAAMAQLRAWTDEPSLLNSDPFGGGWLIKIRTADPSPLDGLMDQDTYDKRFPVSK